VCVGVIKLLMFKHCNSVAKCSQYISNSMLLNQVILMPT
jgi:hypothetical protein